MEIIHYLGQNRLRFETDYAVHPGEILQEHLEARGMSQSEPAELAGPLKKQISLILNEKAPITPESAIRFELILGMDASVWLNLNANYYIFNAKENRV